MNQTMTVTDPSTGATTKNLPKRPFDKFKVISANSTEGYRTMSTFLDKNKGLKLSMKHNIRGEWIVTPHDSKAMDTQACTKDVHLQRLSSAQKLTKAVVLGLPLQIPEEDLTKTLQHCQCGETEKQRRLLN